MLSQNEFVANISDTTLEELGFPASNWTERLCDEAVRFPSLFGRLITISSLRENTHRHGNALMKCFGEGAFDSLLQHLHLRVFTAWIGLSLRRQKADIEVFLDSVADKDDAVGRLQQTAKWIIPSMAQETEQNLLLQDLAVIHALLRSEHMNVHRITAPLSRLTVVHNKLSSLWT
jgi:hypothetical protein